MARNQSEELTVKGVVVDSVNEANVAKALDRLNIDYAYQYYFGELGTRGSQIIDFLLYTVPKPTPLFVHGEYWHTGSFAIEETIKMEQIKSIMRGTWADPKVIWGDQCETVDDAYVNLQTLLL